MKTMGYVVKEVPPGKPLVGKFIGMFRASLPDKPFCIAKVLSAKEENGANHITYQILSGVDKGVDFYSQIFPTVCICV